MAESYNHNYGNNGHWFWPWLIIAVCWSGRTGEAWLGGAAERAGQGAWPAEPEPRSSHALIILLHRHELLKCCRSVTSTKVIQMVRVAGREGVFISPLCNIPYPARSILPPHSTHSSSSMSFSFVTVRHRAHPRPEQRRCQHLKTTPSPLFLECTKHRTCNMAAALTAAGKQAGHAHQQHVGSPVTPLCLTRLCSCSPSPPPPSTPLRYIPLRKTITRVLCFPASRGRLATL